MGDKVPSTVKELGKAFADLADRFTLAQVELKKELGGLIERELETVKASMDVMNEKFEQFKAEVVTLRKDVACVKTENRELRKENSRLVNELKELRRDVVDLQQYSRKNNLEIKGVPLRQNENPFVIIQTICSSLKSEISESDVETVHRVPSKDKNKPNIVVKFASLRARDRVLKAARKCRINTSALGFEDSDPIYINEHLCPANKVLLGKALAAKREKNWRFTWVSAGKILMRKAEQTKVLHVTCAEDLTQVV